VEKVNIAETVPATIQCQHIGLAMFKHNQFIIGLIIKNINKNWMKL